MSSSETRQSPSTAADKDLALPKSKVDFRYAGGKQAPRYRVLLADGNTFIGLAPKSGQNIWEALMDLQKKHPGDSKYDPYRCLVEIAK